MQLLTAQIVKPARICNTKFGQRFALDLTIDGQPETIWGPSNRVPVQRPGEWVTLGRDSKGKLHLVEGDNTPIATVPPTHQPSQGQGMTPETKRAIAAYVGEMGDLYAFCFNTVYDKLPDASEETQRAAASSLFIAAQRKFNLT